MQGLIEVKIENYQGENIVSSRTIAEQLSKRHADVIKQIEVILTDENIRSLIKLSNYKDLKGETRKQYLLTKDGFILYMFNIQGYNDFKRAYINKFNEMENKLKNPLEMLLSMSKEELVQNTLSLVTIIKEKEEIIKEKNTLIEKQKPAVDFTRTLLKSNTNILVREFAKILQDDNIKIGEKKLYEWFRSKKYLNKNNEPYQQYMKYFAIIERVVNTNEGVKTVLTTKITPAGQTYFWSKLNKELNLKIENGGIINE